MAKQECAHEDCDCTVNDGRGVTRGDETQLLRPSRDEQFRRVSVRSRGLFLITGDGQVRVCGKHKLMR